jgi:hypothetical protein
MQAIPLLFASLGGGAAVGAGAAVAGGATAAAVGTAAAAASTGATFAGIAGSLATGLSIVGTVASLSAANSQANYTASVASRNAVIAERNAVEATENAQRENRQRGAMASGEIGNLLANQAASGLNLGSGSYALARKSQAALAANDSEITTETATRQARNFREQGAGFKSEAAQSLASKKYNRLSAGLQIGTSLVSGAAKTNRATARKYN